MGRDIKFRAWDVDRKEMSESFELGSYPKFSNGRTKPYWTHTTIQLQFTGLKDKNGKEIYEGDILKAYDFLHVGFKDSGIPDSPYDVFEDIEGVVVFEEGGFIFSEFQVPVGTTKDIEVIGNIYETPELLPKERNAQESDTTVDATKYKSP